MKIQLSDHFTYKKLIRFVMPSVIMMVFTSIYGVVDGLFVSNLVGKTPFAAINLIMPFIMVVGGMGFMIGTGGTALVARVLGEGDRERANRYFSMMVVVTIIVAVTLSTIGYIFMPQVAVFLKASDEMLPYCVSYGRISMIFTVCYMLQSLFQSFLVAAEKPKLGLFCTIAAGVTNMVLDYVFVGVLRLGVEGAAYATGISMTVGGVLPFIYFAFPNNSPLRLRPVGLELAPIIQACTNGVSELMSNISSSIVGMLYNFQLMKYIGEDGVSAYGVIMYTLFIFIAIFIGFSIGSSPIISYNFGAENHKEMKNMFKKSVILMSSFGVILAVLAILSAPILAGIFVGYDKSLFLLTERAIVIYSVHFVFAGFNIFASALFTALNNGLISAIISFLRSLVFQLAAVLVLPAIIGVDGIWWAVMIAETCSFTVSVFFVVKNRKRYHYYGRD